MQLEISRQIGYAAGRFGHVMLPENVYEPALQCAELLINLLSYVLKSLFCMSNQIINDLLVTRC